MTAVVTSASRPLPTVPAALLPLARFEARRLVRHPVLAVGAALSLLAVATPAHPTVDYLSRTVVGFIPISLAAMAVMFLAASRTVRDDATDLVAPLVASPATRHGALLLGSAAALTPAALLLGVVAHLVRGGAGLELATTSGIVDRVPTAVEVITPMAAVLTCAAVGVLLGRLLPLLVVIPALAVFSIVQLIAATWGLSNPGRWLLPFVNPTISVGWVQVTPGSGYDVVSGIAVTGIAWHLAYLVALTSLAALVTLAADHRRLGLRVAAALAAGATVALAVAQLGGRA